MDIKKYRVYIVTTRGRFWAASSNSVNGLARVVQYWLDTSAAGRAVYDDQVQGVQMYKFEPELKDFTRVSWQAAHNRKDIVREVRKLGAR